MKQFTVIWLDSWQSGSQKHQQTKMSRVEAETIQDVMKEYGDYAVYIFQGHPLMEGETMVDYLERGVEKLK